MPSLGCKKGAGGKGGHADSLICLLGMWCIELHIFVAIRKPFGRVWAPSVCWGASAASRFSRGSPLAEHRHCRTAALGLVEFSRDPLSAATQKISLRIGQRVSTNAPKPQVTTAVNVMRPAALMKIGASTERAA